MDSDNIGTPVDADELYCSVEDVERIIRGYNFNENSNPSEDDVEDFIAKRTRYVEKEVATAWRELEFNDKEIEATPSTKQQRQRNRRGTFTQGHESGYVDSVFSTDRWVKIELPHYRIKELNELEVLTAVGEPNDILEDDSMYQLDKRDGVLRVDYRAFKPTSSGRFGSDRLKDARVRVSYGYGRDYVSADIEDATRKLVAYDIINSDAFGEVRSDEENFVSPDDFTERIYEESHEILNSYK